ncbi:MAG TPA: ATPase, partial [Planctomycetaceae bacterium]|nr:ATPase [Planctomycetaceae bacterium]
DLPNRAARERILAIHLERRKRQPDQFDLARLAEQTEGYSGAELEQLILAGLYNAFNAGVELTTAHLNQQREGTRSLAEMMPERLAQLRAWAADRCVPADE